MSNVPAFDPEQHAYSVDGVALPSVTQVLHATGMLPDYSRLDPFYRERGAAVHAAIQLDLKGDLDIESLTPEVGVHVARFWRFAEAVNLKPVWVEGPLYCPVYRYAGTPDCLAECDQGLVLFDWKCGGFEPGHAVQAAGGYLPLLERAAESGALPVTLTDLALALVAVVPLARDLPSAVWIKDDEPHRDYFRSALAIHNWRALKMKENGNGNARA